MDLSFRRLIQSLRKRVPLALSLADDPTVDDAKKIALLRDLVASMDFVVDLVDCLDRENAVLRKRLERVTRG